MSLSEDRFGGTRIVTTNFDRVFKEISPDTTIYEPPGLPTPSPGLWNGIVYLHGILPIESEIVSVLDRDLEAQLGNLILNYSDFAKAYTTNGATAKFLKKLMTNYTVCFVECSLNDEMLARAVSNISQEPDGSIPPTEKLQWERHRDAPNRPEMKAFAFVGKSNPNPIDEEEWHLKGVTPIFYPVFQNNSNEQSNFDHSTLHQTLVKWADIHKAGTEGKSRLVEEMLSNPANSENISNENEKMIWVLREAKAAKRFAELAKPASIYLSLIHI